MAVTATNESDSWNEFSDPEANPAEEGGDYEYRSVSRAAVLSVIFGLLGGLSWYFPGLLVLTGVGLLLALVALRNFKRFPSELSGRPVAVAGLSIALLSLAVVPAWHAYTFYTELPDGFERVSFAALKSPLGAPDFPPPSAMELDGKKIFLKGYIHPTSLSSNAAKTFILVPDWATCCFGQQPPLTHMIEVRLKGDKFAQKSFRRHALAGTLQVRPYLKPVDGLQGVFYELDAEHFQ